MCKHEIDDALAIAWLSKRTALLSLSVGVSIEIPKEKVDPTESVFIRLDVSRLFPWQFIETMR
jgi:hypothetical protein